MARPAAFTSELPHEVLNDALQYIGQARNILQNFPEKVICRTTDSCKTLETLMVQRLLQRNAEIAEYTVNDTLFLTWCHLRAAGALECRPEKQLTEEDAKWVDARVEQIITEWPEQVFAFDDASLGRFRADIQQLLDSIVQIVVYFCASDKTDEPVRMQGMLADLDFNSEFYSGDRITLGQQLAQQENKSAPNEIPDISYEDEMLLLAKHHKARFGHTKAYLPDQFKSSAFVRKCAHFWYDLELQARCISKHRQRVHIDPAQTPGNAVINRSKVLQWMQRRAQTATINTQMERRAREMFYILHARLGDRAKYIRQKPGMDYKKPLQWNVFLADRGPDYAQFFAQALKYDLKEIFATDRGTLFEVWSWTLWQALFLATTTVSFVDTYAVFDTAIPVSMTELIATKCQGRPRRPLIIHCYNRYWVQCVREGEVARGDPLKHDLWLCHDFLEAMYAWLYLVKTRYNGEMHDRIPAPETLLKLV